MLCKNRLNTIISLGSAGSRRTFVVKAPFRHAPTSIRHALRQALPSSISLRCRSSVAVTQCDYDEFAVKFQGHVASGVARTKFDTPLDETWRINLGRGNANRWLTGPRSDDWFTGMPPSCCPGEFCQKEDAPSWKPIDYPPLTPTTNNSIRDQKT